MLQKSHVILKVKQLKNQTLNIQISRQKSTQYYLSLQALNRALFVLKHLNINKQVLTPIQRP